MATAPKLENLPEVLDIKQVCKVLRIGRSLAYDMIHQKQIPAFRFGRTIRVPKKALEKMLNGGEENALVGQAS
jgi:excisionase family DNA binding protein